MTRPGTSNYLEKIMNTRVLKVFQGYFIACCHILTSYSLLKPLPSEVFIHQEVHGSLLRGLGWSRYSFGRRISYTFSIHVMDLDGGCLEVGRIGSPGLTTPGLDDLSLALFSLRWLGRFSKSIAFLSFIPNSRTRVRLSFRLGYLVHNFLSFVFLHSCHP